MFLTMLDNLLNRLGTGIDLRRHVRDLLTNVKHGLRRIATQSLEFTAHKQSSNQEVVMKRNLILISLIVIAPLYGFANQQMIPAGSLIQCTIAEPKLSSKTTAIGDPVLCHVGHAERFGNAMLPYYSFMGGHFEDYKDPGHFVGKGWMELKFDRMIIEPDTIIPIDAKVVAVPGFNVDRDGRILGRGHAVRDAVEWSIPILWPIDLLMLPRRGPRPTLKAESRLTLKVMDDLMVPVADQPQPDSHGLMHREPSAALELPSAPGPAQYDSRPINAVVDDPSVYGEQPETAAYVQLPVASPQPVVAYQTDEPLVVVPPPMIRRPYRPTYVGQVTASRAYASYPPRPIIRVTRAPYSFPLYRYGRKWFGTPQRSYSPGMGQRDSASFSVGGATGRGGGRR